MVKQIISILLTTLLLTGCEVIKEKDRLIPVPVGDGSKTHLLVEYTGFRCVNCPTAAQTAQDLQQLYGDKLVVVAMHPASNPFTQGAFDYTCPEADICYKHMGGNASTPFPTGNIDLAQGDGEWFFDPIEWATCLLQNDDELFCPALKAQATVDTLTRKVHFTISAVAFDHTEARLAIWLTEDSVMGAQAMPDGSVETAYYHRHMLRGAVQGKPFGWDVEISFTPQRFTADYTLPDQWNIHHCHAVVLLLDRDNYKVLQTYETKLDGSSPVAALRER